MIYLKSLQGGVTTDQIQELRELAIDGAVGRRQDSFVLAVWFETLESPDTIDIFKERYSYVELSLAERIELGFTEV